MSRKTGYVELEACSRCGKRLVKRTNRKTKQVFFGCSDYPDCLFTASAMEDEHGNFIPYVYVPTAQDIANRLARNLNSHGIPDADHIAFMGGNPNTWGDGL